MCIRDRQLIPGVVEVLVRQSAATHSAGSVRDIGRGWSRIGCRRIPPDARFRTGAGRAAAFEVVILRDLPRLHQLPQFGGIDFFPELGRPFRLRRFPGGKKLSSCPAPLVKDCLLYTSSQLRARSTSRNTY